MALRKWSNWAAALAAFEESVGIETPSTGSTDIDLAVVDAGGVLHATTVSAEESALAPGAESASASSFPKGEVARGPPRDWLLLGLPWGPQTSRYSLRGSKLRPGP